MKISQNQIINCYRYILGREPENIDVINPDIWKGKSLAEMIDFFAHSDEFLWKHGLQIKKEINTNVFSGGELISYAQNGEDIVLWRALHEVSDGFYIDVGANHPTDMSVTKIFYDKGWSGINCEPVEEYWRLFQSERKRDININKLIGSRNGSHDFFEIDGTGLSTTVAEIAESHNQYAVKKIQKEMVTLSDLCSEFVKGKEINFLKIDVEGSEMDVIRGCDFTKYRPWICVIEGCIYKNREDNDTMKKNGYKFSLFDGLNCWYVSEEKEKELGDIISIPASVMDGYITFREFSIMKQLELLRGK